MNEEELKEKEYRYCKEFNIYTINKCIYCPYYDTCNKNKKNEKQDVLKRSGIYE